MATCFMPAETTLFFDALEIIVAVFKKIYQKSLQRQASFMQITQTYVLLRTNILFICQLLFKNVCAIITLQHSIRLCAVNETSQPKNT